MGEKHYLSLTAAARKEKLILEPLLEVCRSGRIEAHELGGEWFVAESELPKLTALDRSERISFNQPLLRPLVGLLLLVSIIFSTQAFWRLAVWRDLVVGASHVKIVVSENLTRLSAAPAITQSGALVFADVTRELTGLWLKLIDFWQTLVSNLNYGWSKIAGAWGKFLGRAPPAPTDNVLPALDPEFLAQLKAEIKAELSRELLNLPPVPAGPSGPGAGLVVLPSSGDRVKDQLMAKELESSFSDRVEIRFEASGKTGVITPVFPGGRGEDYLFVITPIRKSEQ